MTSDFLTDSECKTVEEILQAVAFGSFIDEWEFQSLMGLSRKDVKEVAAAYPDVDECDDGTRGCDDSWLAINNSFLNLLEFSEGKEPEYREFLSVTPEELLLVFRKWRGDSAKSADS